MRQLAVTFCCLVSGCITIPVSQENHVNACEISSDYKTLKVIDVAKETNSYYSISGTILSPILVPITAIISGTYVTVNNIYHLGEEKIICGEVQQ